MDPSGGGHRSAPFAEEDERLLALNVRLDVQWRDFLMDSLPDDWPGAVYNVEDMLAGRLPDEWTNNLDCQPPTSRGERAIWNFVRVLCNQLPRVWIDSELTPPLRSDPDGLTIVLEELTTILMADQDESFDDNQESSVALTSIPGASSSYMSRTQSLSGRPRPSSPNTPIRFNATMVTLSPSAPRDAFTTSPTLFSTQFPCQNCGRVHPVATPACARPGSLVAFIRRILRRRDDTDNVSIGSDTRTHISNPPPPYERGDWVEVERPPSYISHPDLDSTGLSNDEAGIEQPHNKVTIFRRLLSCAQRMNRDVYKQDAPTQQELEEVSDLMHQLRNEPPRARALLISPPQASATTQASARQIPQQLTLLSPFRRFVETAKTGRAVRKAGLDLRKLGRMERLIGEGAEEDIPTEDMLAFSHAILIRAQHARLQSMVRT